MWDLGGQHRSRPPAFFTLLIAGAFLLLLLTCPPPSAAAISETGVDANQLEEVVMLTLDKEPIVESFVVLERSGRTFLPVCALSEALSLALQCQDRRAFGFIIDEARPIVIDPEESYTISARTVYRFRDDSVFSLNGEVYADAEEVSKWLPLDFEFEKNTSTIQIHPREVLPLQDFKKRQKLKRPPPPHDPKQFPDFTSSRALASIPVIDFASQLLVSGEERATMQGRTLNSLDLSGDLLYMSGEAHVSAENETFRRLDLSLSRRTDTAFNLGPVPLTQIRLGSSQVPYIDGIGASSKPMYGAYFSNRPACGSTNFLRHDINGSLPQGWDAELFHNGMPVAYQPPTSDNMYHFRNLQVYYGINEFKVVQHGPLGERRESQERFVSDAITPKREFLYTVSTLWETGLTRTELDGPHRETNVTLTSDFGISQRLTGATYLVRHTDLYGVERDYAGAGLRSALGYTLLSLDLIEELFPANGDAGGLFTLKSSSRDLLGLFLEATQRVFWNFDSPQFPREGDSLLTRTILRGNSSLTAYGLRIPFSVDLGVDSRRSGDIDETSAWRISGGWDGWNAALEADVSNLRHVLNAAGIVQISTKLSDISIRGEAGLSFAPTLSAATVNINADKELGGGVVMNSGISHDPRNSASELRVGLAKRLGLIGYTFSATGSTRGAYSVNVGMRTSIGVDTGNRQLLVSAEPLSPYGMIAMSAAVAEPGNPQGKPLPGVGFLINGSHATSLSGTRGWPVIINLQPDLPVDVTVDLATVEDPFMTPLEEGCHIIPRAGVVSTCKFTMVTGGEIDGMVFVRMKEGEIPLQDVEVDLYAEGANGVKLQGATRTQESGYYLFKTVKPGSYKVVIHDSEFARLKAAAVAPIAVTMPVGGDMVSGKDFLLTPAP